MFGNNLFKNGNTIITTSEKITLKINDEVNDSSYAPSDVVVGMLKWELIKIMCYNHRKMSILFAFSHSFIIITKFIAIATIKIST